MSRSGYADWCYSTYKEFHGMTPSWQTADYVALASIAKACEDNGEAQRVWRTYLQCGDRFFAGHSPRKLRQNLDRFRQDARRLVGEDKPFGWDQAKPEIKPKTPEHELKLEVERYQRDNPGVSDWDALYAVIAIRNKRKAMR